MNQHSLTLELLPEAFTIVRLDGDSTVPDWAEGGVFTSVTRTPSELSIVCAAALVPPEVRAQPDFGCIRVQGPLDFAEIGVLESLATPLARAGISVFTLSTYDTDYLFLPKGELEAGLSALSAAGHAVRRLGAA